MCFFTIIRFFYPSKALIFACMVFLSGVFSVYGKCHITTDVEGDWAKIKTDEECKLAKKILRWKRLAQNENASFEEIVNFFRKNSDWPNQIALRKKAEHAIDSSTDRKLIREWFRDNPPKTHKGAMAFVKVAHRKDAPIIKKVFEHVTLSAKDLAHYMHHAKKWLEEKAILRRFDFLMYAKRKDEAQDLIQYIPANYKVIAQDRLVLAKGHERKRLVTHDAGYLWQYATYLLKNEQDDALKKLLSEQAALAAEKEEPLHWWDIRKVLVRRFIEKKRYKEASQLTEQTQAQTGVPFAESKWLEGWLNLRFLKNSKKAYACFQKLHETVETSISLSKAAYWAARAAEEHKDHTNQKKWLQIASKYRATFYGQLGSSMLEQDFHPEDYRVTKGEKREFNENELVRAIKLLHKVGQIEMTDLFFYKLADITEKPDEHELLIRLAAHVAGPHTAVQVTKIGAKHVMPLMEEAYPSLAKDLLPPLSNEYKVNMYALVHAVIRKESLFKMTARSPKGAKGLMQIMDGTAKQVSKSDNIKYINIFDPQTNVNLGEAYLRRLLARYKGSLILTLAAYNAGPNRVDEWVEEFGYPGEEGKMEAVEWINRIPYYETRNYVERVLENYWHYAITFQGASIKKWHEKLF